MIVQSDPQTMTSPSQSDPQLCVMFKILVLGKNTAKLSNIFDVYSTVEILGWNEMIICVQ